MDDEKRRESYVDKCIWVESLSEARDVAYHGEKVKSAIMGTVIEDMRIRNCGYVDNSLSLSTEFMETCTSDLLLETAA